MADWTEKELREFDRITLLESSQNQMERIEGRLAVSRFVKDHGREKCEAIFAEIKRREKEKKGNG